MRLREQAKGFEKGVVVAGTIGTREWDTEEVARFFTRLLD
jgi:hypothetical protein